MEIKKSDDNLKKIFLTAILLLAITTMVFAESVTVQISASPSSIAQGQTSAITATATASSAVSNVILTISLPSGLSSNDSLSQTISSISAGASSSKSWNIQGDVASNASYTITVTASSGATGSGNTSLTVSTPAFIDVQNFSAIPLSCADKNCPVTDTNSYSINGVGQHLSVSFQLNNSGGSSTKATVALSISGDANLLNGASNWQNDINGGSYQSLSWDFNIGNFSDTNIVFAITANSNDPNDVWVFVDDNVNPGRVTTLAASDGNRTITGGSVDLNWTAITQPDIASYKVFLKKNTSFANDSFSGLDANSTLTPTNANCVASDTTCYYNYSGLSNDQNYCFAIAAVDNAGNYDFNANGIMKCATPRDTKFPTFTLSSSTTSTSTSYSLTGTTDDNATCRYSSSANIVYSNDSYFTTMSSTNGTSHSASFSGLSNQTYTYYIKCRDANGNISGDFNASFTVSASTTTTTTSTSGSSSGSSSSAPAVTATGKGTVSDANNAITATNTAKSNIDSNISFLLELGAELNKDANSLIEQAKAKLALAETEKAKSDANYLLAKKYAEEANTLFEQSKTKMPDVNLQVDSKITITQTIEEIKSALETAGIKSEQVITGSQRARNFFKIERQTKTYSIKAKDSNDTNYTTNFVLKVKNDLNADSNATIKDFNVIETIPKSIAMDANQISSKQSFAIIKKDPIIMFAVPELKPGKEIEFKYTVKKKVDQNSLQEFSKPVIALEEKQALEIKKTAGVKESIDDLCIGKKCDDNNPCSLDSCKDGNCLHDAIADKTKCGNGMICSTGKCVKESELAKKINIPLEAIAIIIIIPVLLIAFAIIRKRKNKLTFK